MATKFGPAGNADLFYAQGHKRSQEMPAWLAAMGLDAYEYSFGRGVNLKEDTARAIGAQAAAHGIAMSVHAPYYINLASPEAEKREKSRDYLRQAARAASWLGATRVVFHPGSCAKLERTHAMDLALGEMEALREGLMADYPDITLCPETMGKRNQLGTAEEIVALCGDFPRFIPTLDFGHINALTAGSLKTPADFDAVLDTVERGLGQARMRQVHVHFSHIQYGPSGEIRHLRFDDAQYGPFFQPLCQVLVARDMEARVICESAGTMAEDALAMKEMYVAAMQAAGKDG